jgi:hypothetical protein
MYQKKEINGKKNWKTSKSLLLLILSSFILFLKVLLKRRIPEKAKKTCSFLKEEFFRSERTKMRIRESDRTFVLPM